jgi:hypothetical protein
MERWKWRTIDGFQMCPYVDCDGDAVIESGIAFVVY